jgi:hypothetical protein
MKIQSTIIELFHADRRTNWQTDMAKAVGAFLQLLIVNAQKIRFLPPRKHRIVICDRHLYLNDV